MRNKFVVGFATWIYRLFFPYVLALVSLPVYFFKYRKYHAVEAVKIGFADHSKQGVDVSDEVLYRLFNAYIKAKHDQTKVSQCYQVGYLWQEILDTRFKVITDAIYDGDLSKVKKILSNFNRDDCGYDTCGGYQYYHRMKHVPFYKYQFINSWYHRFNNCKDVTGGFEPVFSLKPIGNPVGMYYDGQVVPLCNLEYYCYAWEMMGLLKSVKSPTICEIGGGVGGQAHEVLVYDIPDLTYILLDIPEVLLISSYYLMTAFPEKKFLLYGEGDIKEGYDAILMPNFVLPKMADKSVDLFFNSCSFSEMNYNTVKEYLTQIERICKYYLMHINHNARLVWHEGKKKITNMIADEVVPNPFLFQRVYRKPRLFELLEDTFVIHWFYGARYYQYLYERRESVY